MDNIQTQSKTEVNMDVTSSLLSLDGYIPTKVKEDKLNASLLPQSTKVYKPWYKSCKNWIKIMIVIGLVTMLIFAVVYHKTTENILDHFLKWIEKHTFWGAFSFIGIYWLCTILMIPGSILTLGAGYVFSQALGELIGVLVASIIVLIGANLGAINAFILARFVLRENVKSYTYKYEKYNIMDMLLRKNGFKVTLLLRLAPIIPFNVFNYIMGITSVTSKGYIIATLLGMIPGTIAYCLIGATLSAVADAGSVGFSNPTVLIFTVVGTVVALIGMICIGYIARKEFRKLANEIEENQSDSV